ncbi:uncharacterized protein LOC142229964 [Haematobia irritans]|uniref:uncharacterized protein LOC142229964 n=1 Tax=Haematobia irritans TaxID=7368 RepID=UPI003F507BE0
MGCMQWSQIKSFENYVLSSLQKRVRHKRSIKLNGCNIEYTQHVRNLGVIFDNDLSWNRHIDNTIGTVYGMLRSLWPVQFFISVNVRRDIANAYLLSRLLYCCEVYVNCDSNHVRKLRTVTNDIARFVYGVNRFQSISCYAKDLYGMLFNKLLEFRCLISLHKLIHYSEPKYLFERLIFTQSPRLRCLKPFRSRYLVSDRQFFIIAIRLWNNLPLSLRTQHLFPQFKRELRRHFTLMD